jgi:hypothetical protein
MKEPYTAVIKHSGAWWIGWIEEVTGVNCQVGLGKNYWKRYGQRSERRGTRKKLSPYEREELLSHLRARGCELL